MNTRLPSSVPPGNPGPPESGVPSALSNPLRFPKLADSRLKQVLIFGLHYPDSRVRAIAIFGLLSLPDDSLRDDSVKGPLTPLLLDSDQLVSSLAEYALGRCGVCVISEEQRGELHRKITLGLESLRLRADTSLAPDGYPAPEVASGFVSGLSEDERLTDWSNRVDSLMEQVINAPSAQLATQAAELLEESLAPWSGIDGTHARQIGLVQEFGRSLPARLLVAMLHGPSHTLATGAGFHLGERGPVDLQSVIPDLIGVLCNPSAVGHSTAIQLLRSASPEAIEPLKTAARRGIVGMGGVYARELVAQLRAAPGSS